MKIEFCGRDKSFADGDTINQDLLNSLKRKYEEERKEIHVSDLTVCPRETVFKKREQKELNVRDLLNFASGEAIHLTIEELVINYPDKYEDFDKDLSKYSREKQNRIWYKDLIVCTPDLMNVNNEIVYELKSTKTYEMDEPKTFHLRQLACYMAIWQKKVGYIVYMLLDPWKVKQNMITKQKQGQKLKAVYDPMENPFPKWRLTMTNQDIAATLDWLEREVLHLKKAIESNRPEEARHIANDDEFFNHDKDGRATYNWKCKGCKYLKECSEMRAQEERGNLFHKIESKPLNQT